MDLTKSFVLLSWKAGGNGTGVNFLKGRLTLSTELTIDRAVTGNAIDYAWEVIELTDASTVQSGDLAFGASDTTLSATLTAVDLARAVPFLSTAVKYQACAESPSIWAISSQTFVRMKLTSDKSP